MIAAARQTAARHPDRAAAIALAGLVFFLFTPAVLGQRVFFQRDILFYWYPHIENAVRAVAEGAWPTWTPYVAFGRPLLADPNLQLLYPPTWLNLVMLPPAYYTVFVVAHCWAAGLGAYLLGRESGLSPAAAALPAALWSASGPLLSSVNLFHHFAGAAWMPWVLLLVLRALARPTLAAGVLLGAAGGGQALTGSADMGLLTVIAAAVYAAGYVWDGGRRWPARLAVGARMALLSGVFAGLLAAVQWVPALALLRGGARATQDPAVSTAWSVHPASLADLFFPRLMADMPMRPELRAIVFDGRQPLLASLYLGIASVPLVALALAGHAHALKRWAVLALSFFLLAALGRHTAAYAFLAAVPPLSLVRYPAKFMVPAALFWALLAGRGLDVWMTEWMDQARRRARFIAIVCAALVLAALLVALVLSWSPAALNGLMAGAAEGAAAIAARKLAVAAATLGAACIFLALRAARSTGTGWLTGALSGVVVLDAASAGREVNPLGPPELWQYRPPAATQIGSAPADARLYVRQESAEQLNAWLVRGTDGWDSQEGWAVGAYDLLVPPIGARWRIAGSYDGDFTGLAPPALSVFSLVLPELADDPLSLKLLRIGAVTHVTSLRERPFVGLQERAVFPSVFARPVRLYGVPDALPRVYAVGGARTARTYNEAMAAMAEPRFDPLREVILPAGAAVHAEPAGFAATARVTWRRMDGLGAEVELSAAGWLVLVEAYEPGWRARVDGESVDVLSANALFRAVPVPAGRHRVELTYWPPGLRAGLLLSGCAVVAAVSTAARRRQE